MSAHRIFGPPTPRPGNRQPTDLRYSNRRWRTVRLRVLARDGEACMIEAGCPFRATVADHIVPVYPGMPDSEFYDPTNLRASCRGHNLARPIIDATAQARGEAPPARPSRSIYGTRYGPAMQVSPAEPYRDSRGHYTFPVHSHVLPDGWTMLTGDYGHGQHSGPGCPSSCPLPKAAV